MLPEGLYRGRCCRQPVLDSWSEEEVRCWHEKLGSLDWAPTPSMDRESDRGFKAGEAKLEPRRPLPARAVSGSRLARDVNPVCAVDRLAVLAI